VDLEGEVEMGHLIALLLVILIGSILSAVIDDHLGLSKVLSKQSFRVQISHKLFYVLYGAAIGIIITRWEISWPLADWWESIPQWVPKGFI
jgi:hypothetical protein